MENEDSKESSSSSQSGIHPRSLPYVEQFSNF
jgi:hypothetical protein